MYKNTEGYPDPTAASAIYAVCMKEKQDSKRKNGGTNMEQIYRGDIWNVECANGKNVDMLVLSVHQSYCTTLTLIPEEPAENAIMVIGKKKMYSDVGKLGYALKSRLLEFVKAVSDDEMEHIEHAVMDALGVQYQELDISNASSDLKKESVERPDDIETVTVDEISIDRSKVDLGHEIQIAKLTAERDMMKNLYEDAVSKLMTM